MTSAASGPTRSAEPSRIELPERPARLRDRDVAAWSEPIVIDIYPPPAPDRNPLCLEKRVHQGSSRHGPITSTRPSASPTSNASRSRRHSGVIDAWVG